MLGLFLIIVHLICIHGTILMLTFSTSLIVVGLMTFFTFVVFIQCLIFNGCILTHHESVVPGINQKMTQFVKSRLGVKGDIPNGALEKVFVGVTLFFFLVKLTALSFGWVPVQKRIDGLFPNV
jgi:hypothetical protein